MTHEFRLADIGEGLEQAEIVAWRVEVGDVVERDQPLVEVMTDKSNAELPAPVAGVVTSLRGAIGDIVEVGEVLAVINTELTASPAIDADGATLSTTSDIDAPTELTPHVDVATTFRAATAPVVEPHGTAPLGDPAGEPSRRSPRSTRIKAAPSTRAEAARRGIDLATVRGSGPGGRILLGDLDAAPSEHSPGVRGDADDLIEGPEHDVNERTADDLALEPTDRSPDVQLPAARGTESTVPLRGVRRAIARNMAQSWSSIPHIHASQLIDAEPMVAFRNQLRLSGRRDFERLTPISFFVAAVASALAAHPEANAVLDMSAETITHHEGVHVGIAVASPSGLIVPVVRDADRLSLAALSSQVERLVDGARAGSLTPEDMRGGTVTISNFGSLGAEHALPLIRPGESVIFGFGSIAPRPFVVNDTVEARSTLNVVVGTDHRLLDGDVTTSLLVHVADLLATPINLVLG